MCHSWTNSASPFNQSIYLTRECLKFFFFFLGNPHPLLPPLSEVLQARICLEWFDLTLKEFVASGLSSIQSADAE